MIATLIVPAITFVVPSYVMMSVTNWWNDLLIPLIFIQSDSKMTVTFGVATVPGRHSTDFPLLLTGLFMSSIPPMLVYILLQRIIRRGLVIGAVK